MKVLVSPHGIVIDFKTVFFASHEADSASQLSYLYSFGGILAQCCHFTSPTLFDSFVRKSKRGISPSLEALNMHLCPETLRDKTNRFEDRNGKASSNE